MHTRHLVIRAIGLVGLLILAACAAQSTAPTPTATGSVPAQRAPLPAASIGSY